MRTFARYFVQGLLILLPIVTTLGILTWIFHYVDNMFPVNTPGLGFVLAVLLTTIVGWLGSKFVGRWIVRGTEWLLEQIPLVASIYNTVKDLLQAVAGEKKTFDRPVIVTLQAGGDVSILGFITREDLHEIGLPGHVAVLLQQSLNFAGNLVIFPKERVKPLPVDSGKFLTFVLSGGLTGGLDHVPAAATIAPPPPEKTKS